MGGKTWWTEREKCSDLKASWKSLSQLALEAGINLFPPISPDDQRIRCQDKIEFIEKVNFQEYSPRLLEINVNQ